MISRRAFFGVAAGVSTVGVGGARYSEASMCNPPALESSDPKNRQGGDCLQIPGTAAKRVAGDERGPVDYRPERRQQGIPRRLRGWTGAAIVRDRHPASERHYARRRGVVDLFHVQL